jgi:hypothetical protein
MPNDYGIEFSSRKEAEEMHAHIIDVFDSQVQLFSTLSTAFEGTRLHTTCGGTQEYT